MADARMVELFAAVKEGNEAKIKELIAKGICLNNFKDESHIASGAMPTDPELILQAAIEAQNIEIVKLVLTLPGIYFNNQEITIAAIQTKNTIFLKELCTLGLMLNPPIFTVSSALTTAVATQDINVVELVYNSGARFSTSKDEIWKAFENGSIDILDFLLRRSSIVKSHTVVKTAWTLLHEAVMQDDLEVVKLFVKYMPQHEINISGKKLGDEGKYETPLALAVLRNNVEITKHLITVGADLNKGGCNLYNAVIAGNNELVGILLKGGISTDLDAKFSITILHVAVLIGNVDIIKQLLLLENIHINAKVDLSCTVAHNFKQIYGDLYVGDISYDKLKNETTAIQLAVMQNDVAIAIELLNHNADINIPNQTGCKPWCAALVHSHNNILKILLEEYKSKHLNFNINAHIKKVSSIMRYKTLPRNIGYVDWNELCDKTVKLGTALHHAVSSGNLEAVDILLEHGASLSEVNGNEETSLFGWILLFNDPDKIFRGLKFFKDNGANINHVNATGRTILNEAIRYGNYDLVNALILEGADMNCIKTAELLKSCQKDEYSCHMDIVNLLLQYRYHFQDISKVINWLSSIAVDPYHKGNGNTRKAQDIICHLLDCRNLGYDIQNKASELLLTSAEHDLQILGKYLLTQDQCTVDVNANYSSSEIRETSALDIVLKKCNYDFIKMILDAGAKCNLRKLMRKVLIEICNMEKGQCIPHTEENITTIINLFDTILNKDIDVGEVFAFNIFEDSPIALSVKAKLHWAVEYFIQHKTVRNKLHLNTVFISSLFKLLLLHFHISTAKILVDEYWIELLQPNSNILHWFLKFVIQNQVITVDEKKDFIKCLIHKGFDINSQDEEGKTVLYHAVLCNAENQNLVEKHAFYKHDKHDNHKILSFLLDSECEVNAPNNSGQTPLLLACEYEEANMVKLLVKHGAKPDSPDENGITPIHMCIIKKLYEPLFLLLSIPCDFNKKTKNNYRTITAGSTPFTALLMGTYSYETQEIGEKLMDMGAEMDVNICNKDGDSALHIAIRNNCKASLLKKLLNEYSPNTIIQNNKGWSVLHISVDKQMLSHVELILKEKCNVNSKTNFPGYTALHMAVQHTNVALVEMLLKAGGSVFITDMFGKKCMDLCEINLRMTNKIVLWQMLMTAGGFIRRLTVKKNLLNILQISNLLDLLIESGCNLQFQGHSLLEQEASLLAKLTAKQQQPLSLMRLVANTVRTNIYPNAIYSSNKLPLPASIQRFICFHDSHHGHYGLNPEAIQSFSQQN